MTAFGDELRRLLAERGMSLNEAARQAPCNAGYLSKVASGRKRPSPKMAHRLDEVLGADGTLAALAQDAPLFDGSLSPDDRDRIGWVGQHPGRLDAAVIDSFETVLAAQRRAEDVLGSAAMLRPVKAQMAVIEDLVKEARGGLRPRLVHVAGQWAQYTGWLYANTARQAEGDAWLGRALHWAVEVGEPNLISEVLSFQGHAAWIAGQPGPLIGLSQAAQRDRSIYPGQLAISAAQEAQGHAMTGDGHDVDRLLDRADALAAAARDRLEDAPPWLYYHSPGFFALQRGLAYRYLGADPVYRRRAIAALSTGHATLPADEISSEWGAEFLIHLAAVHAQDGEVEQACAAALQAAGIARAASSARLLRLLRRLRAGLAARWPNEAGVTELAEALR
jgi:transcriptional regulator with XRE-family HTH domain